jgi:hypothetical protein
MKIKGIPLPPREGIVFVMSFLSGDSESIATIFRRLLSIASHSFSTFPIHYSSERQACGPEARAFRAKSIGGKRNPFGDTPVFPQNGAGPSGVTQFGIRNVEFGIFTSFFSFRIPHSNCPPGLRNETCLMVFARNALASGPGNI